MLLIVHAHLSFEIVPVELCVCSPACSMPHYPEEIEYSERYNDDTFEFRHVILPKAIAKDMFRITGGKRLLEEDEWRGLGVTQSRGWYHYEIHRPEPHILLFRRPVGTDPATGKVPDKVMEVLRQ